SFEPSIDYVVTKIPRFTFEKFPQAENSLTTQMKSVGEVMAIGRTFHESLQKALRGLEVGIDGLTPILDTSVREWKTILRKELQSPGSDRILYLADAIRQGMGLEEIFELTHIDPWFLNQIDEIVQAENEIAGKALSDITAAAMFKLKQFGFADTRLAQLLSSTETKVRKSRQKQGIRPVYRRVDTCAAEFASSTAYMYSTYEEECESRPTTNNKIMVLGGGPNRIGQGIEFDYCCVHAALAMREDGYETIMVNCNPETVSTDYDTSDRLYFEPLTLEDVLAIVDLEKPKGVIVQFGGQTPLKLAHDLEKAGVPIIGTSPDAIDRAEDRERFQQMIVKLGLKQPPNRTVKNIEAGLLAAAEIGYPLVVRPSYVLGGRAMEIVYDDVELKTYMTSAVKVSNKSPVLLDRFLDQAIEVDIDAISDGTDVVIGAVMEHIEQAGVHSGDSACSLPPYSLSADKIDEMRKQVTAMALELRVIGLMNVQLAVQNGDIYVLEVNPRASRTVPFVSKCIGVSLAQVAARCMAGTSLIDQGFTREVVPDYFSVKEAVFPFGKFPGVDPILGPEMKSTGEVMGVGRTFGEAYGKAQLAAGDHIPRRGKAFLSVRDADKSVLADLARDLVGLGFSLVATRGSAAVIAAAGIEVQIVNKVLEGRPHIVDMLKNKEVDFIINTTEGKQAIADSFMIRRTALQQKVYNTTTMAGGRACVLALRHEGEYVPQRLQDLHQRPCIKNASQS
ncbi:MAG: carbamoyl-phosphate synthase large subunit, partial [Proteobacteria bacterium]|nr:carbamoyl-phosphate synthase large subunit [Pseudomonadota bacterium]